MTETILRQARRKDTATVKKILGPWLKEDAYLYENLESLMGKLSLDRLRCTVLETDDIICAVSLWIVEEPDLVRVLAFQAGNATCAKGSGMRLLQEEILEWAQMGISRVTIEVPEALASTVIGSLRTCGFLVEGLSQGFGVDRKPRVRMSKHFIYRTIPHKELMSFIQEVMISLGYEVRREPDGLRYRVREEFRFPFIFSPWHRITASGPDIIVHPPARVLQWHDLETLFFPLRIWARNDRPLLVPMDMKKAKCLIEFPGRDPRQKSLFNATGEGQEKLVRASNVAYSYSAGKRTVRKGLPLLFYVNRVGAVGTARVESSHLEDPEHVASHLEEMGFLEPEGGTGENANKGPKIGKVLVVQFQWYRPLIRSVTLEEIRSMDENFNPQRSRSISCSLFDSIISAGNRLD